jgi:DNA modification methylase
MMKETRSLRKKARYFQLLPLTQDTTIINQFGWLPVSIIRPEKDTLLDGPVGDDGDVMGSRRPNNRPELFQNIRYSRFHSELAELIIKYWSVKGAMVVDPFAGRATRGVMSLRLGRKYEGYEVAPDTYKKNEQEY